MQQFACSVSLRYLDWKNILKGQTPVPVAARSKVSACGLSPSETVSSNPTGGMDVCLCECCVLSGRGLCDELITRPEESYRLWCVVVWSRNLMNEEALARWGLSHQKRAKQCVLVLWMSFYCIVFTTCFGHSCGHLQGGDNKNTNTIIVCLNQSTV
jgi:hypothetical protein